MRQWGQRQLTNVEVLATRAVGQYVSQQKDAVRVRDFLGRVGGVPTCQSESVSSTPPQHGVVHSRGYTYHETVTVVPVYQTVFASGSVIGGAHTSLFDFCFTAICWGTTPAAEAPRAKERRRAGIRNIIIFFGIRVGGRWSVVGRGAGGLMVVEGR